MNTTMTQNDLSTLMSTRHLGPFVAIYLPTRTMVTDLAHQRLQFQSLIKTAADKFVKQFPQSDFEPYARQFKALLSDNTFWLKHTGPQTGLIASSSDLTVFDLQYEAPATVIVSSLPAVLPILADRQRQNDFELICLNEDNFSWYHYRQHELQPVELPEDAPRTLKIALGDELRGGETNFNASPVHGPSYHGHNAKAEEKEIDQRNYYQLIDTYLADALTGPNNLPIILFALPHNQAVYRKISKLPHLIELNIPKSPRHLSEAELLVAITPLENKLASQQHTELMTRFDRATSKQLTTTDPLKLIRPALAGRIDTLLINDKVISDESAHGLPDNLMDDLADVVVGAKGTVQILSSAEMPDRSLAAGILRF
ncbi:MAG: hypothetical protein L0I02_00570 [Lactobacillus sp.]|nr:hypothetical protein [Lactobacillus sp.]MDN6052057.1 hypothetical protein [Lactobacillus sp.]